LRGSIEVKKFVKSVVLAPEESEVQIARS
jgi:hypothetical protein